MKYKSTISKGGRKGKFLDANVSEGISAYIMQVRDDVSKFCLRLIDLAITQDYTIAKLKSKIRRLKGQEKNASKTKRKK